MQTARLVSMRGQTFWDYLNKKRAEGKHFAVAVSHVGKKLIRMIYYLLQTVRNFMSQS